MPRQRLDDTFKELRDNGRKGLMPFLVGAHPTRDAFKATLREIDKAGATAIEIGIPFSDPIADGPVIATAMHDVLTAGVHARDVLQDVADTRTHIACPLIAMASVSLLTRTSIDTAFNDLAQAGFDGVILPDAPLEEAEPLTDAAHAADLACALLVAPRTPDDRAAKIAAQCSGFVYLLARAGTTGVQQHAPDDTLAQRVATLRNHTNLPIACGFGISTKQHVAAVCKHADAAIVGSALVKRLTDAGPDNAPQAARDMIDDLKPD